MDIWAICLNLLTEMLDVRLVSLRSMLGAGTILLERGRDLMAEPLRRLDLWVSGSFSGRFKGNVPLF